MKKKVVSTILLLVYTSTNFAEDQVYLSPKYHFRITYPPSLSAKTRFSSTYLLGTDWTVSAETKNNANQHSLLEILLLDYKGTGKEGGNYYYRAYIRVSVSTDPLDIAQCEKPSKRSYWISGKKFHILTYSDAAMMQYNKSTAYRLLKSRICYNLEYVETGTNPSNIPSYDLLRRKTQDLAKQIINTFRLD